MCSYLDTALSALISRKKFQNMFYAIIVFCFLLSSVDRISARNSFHKKIEDTSKGSSLLKSDSAYVGENVNCIERKHPYKAINRQRRSIISRLIENIVTTVDIFHMRPSLVKYKMDNDNFDNLFNSKFNDLMNEIGKKGKRGKSGKSDTNTKGSDKYNKFFGDEKIEDEDDAYVMSEEKKKDGPKFDGLRKKADNIVEMHDKASDIEESLVEVLLKHRGNLNDEDIVDLYLDGINTRKSESIMKSILKLNPSLKGRVANDLKNIRKIRKEIMKKETNVYSHLDNLDLPGRLELNIMLQNIRKKNYQWLIYQHHPDILNGV